jgi:hypothetical protein
VSVANQQLNVPRTPPRSAPRVATWTALRRTRPLLAAVIVRCVEVVGWIAFYIVIRVLVA